MGFREIEKGPLSIRCVAALSGRILALARANAMKLQAISLRQLVEFLEKVESPEHLVGIDKITIQENGKEQGTLDATLQLVSIDKVAGATAQ